MSPAVNAAVQLQQVVSSILARLRALETREYYSPASGGGGVGTDSVLLYRGNDADILVYTADNAGLVAALAAAAAGDTVVLPSNAIDGVVTVPAGIEVRGQGPANSQLSGTVTNNGVLSGVNVTGTLTNNGDLYDVLYGAQYFALDEDTHTNHRIFTDWDDWNVFIGEAGTHDNAGMMNIGIGGYVLNSMTDAYSNIGIGWDSMNSATEAYGNIGIGEDILQDLIDGQYNVAIGGQDTLSGLTSGSYNIGLGTFAGRYLKAGNYNIAIGDQALIGPWAGTGSATDNIAIGTSALQWMDTGTNNVGIGHWAGAYQRDAHNVVYVGHKAGYRMDSDYNLALGFEALYGGVISATGARNIAAGYRALYGITTGNDNLGIGYGAGDNLTTGSRNIIIGYDLNAPVATGDDQMYLGGVIYGDLAQGYIGIGNTAPGTRLHLTEAKVIAGATADGYAGALRMEPGYTAAAPQTVTRHNYLDILDPSPLTNVTVTDAALARFDAGIGTHKALAAAFQTTDSGAHTTDWAGGIKVNINGTLYKIPLVAL